MVWWKATGAFARFLEAISFSHGSLLNLAEVARECQVGRKTVEGYLDILEDLFPPFDRRCAATSARSCWTMASALSLVICYEEGAFTAFLRARRRGRRLIAKLLDVFSGMSSLQERLELRG